MLFCRNLSAGAPLATRREADHPPGHCGQQKVPQEHAWLLPAELCTLLRLVGILVWSFHSRKKRATWGHVAGIFIKSRYQSFKNERSTKVLDCTLVPP